MLVWTEESIARASSLIAWIGRRQWLLPCALLPVISMADSRTRESATSAANVFDQHYTIKEWIWRTTAGIKRMY